jgi:hypothetical protein
MEWHCLWEGWCTCHIFRYRLLLIGFKQSFINHFSHWHFGWCFGFQVFLLWQGIAFGWHIAYTLNPSCMLSCQGIVCGLLLAYALKNPFHFLENPFHVLRYTLRILFEILQVKQQLQIQIKNIHVLTSILNQKRRGFQFHILPNLVVVSSWFCRLICVRPHLHKSQWQQAAMTTLWLHQLLTVGEDKVCEDPPKIEAPQSQNIEYICDSLHLCICTFCAEVLIDQHMGSTTWKLALLESNASLLLFKVDSLYLLIN